MVTDLWVYIPIYPPSLRPWTSHNGSVHTAFTWFSNSKALQLCRLLDYQFKTIINFSHDKIQRLQFCQNQKFDNTLIQILWYLYTHYQHDRSMWCAIVLLVTNVIPNAKHTICRIRWKLLPWKLNACSNSTLSSTVHSSGNGVKFGRSASAFSKLCLCQNSMPSACIKQWPQWLQWPQRYHFPDRKKFPRVFPTRLQQTNQINAQNLSTQIAILYSFSINCIRLVRIMGLSHCLYEKC